MRKISYMAIPLAALLAFGCGNGKNDGQSGTQAAATATLTGTQPSNTPLERNDTIRIGGTTYSVNVERFTDKDLPTVSDGLGTDFYDNRVNISFTPSGGETFSRSFTKKDFEPYLTESEIKNCVLLGMALDPDGSIAGRLQFGAQIGQPGIEEGPLFIVQISSAGAITIAKDTRRLDDLLDSDSTMHV